MGENIQITGLEIFNELERNNAKELINKSL